MPAGRLPASKGLDGFHGRHDHVVEVLLPRRHRGVRTPHRVATTGLPRSRIHTVVIDGFRCLPAERLILDSPLFDLSRDEIENAIDSAIRLRLIREQRVRSGVVSVIGAASMADGRCSTYSSTRAVRVASSDGCRVSSAGPGWPCRTCRRCFEQRDARSRESNAFFPGNLVVGLAGHATHSSRADRQRDEQRRTELTLRGNRVITFTHEDLRDRPDWVAARLIEAVGRLRAA